MKWFKGSRIINMDNVSSVLFNDDCVIFYFTNTININGKFITDFYKEENEKYFADIYDMCLKNENFVKHPNKNEFINIKHITQIIKDPRKNRLILIADHSITVDNKIMGKFYYFELSKDTFNMLSDIDDKVANTKEIVKILKNI